MKTYFRKINQKYLDKPEMDKIYWYIVMVIETCVDFVDNNNNNNMHLETLFI